MVPVIVSLALLEHLVAINPEHINLTIVLRLVFHVPKEHIQQRQNKLVRQLVKIVPQEHISSTLGNHHALAVI